MAWVILSRRLPDMILLRRMEMLWGGSNGIRQKEVPDRVSNIERHDETTTNHVELLTEDHWWIEMFFDIRYYNILYVLHEVQLEEEFQAWHVLDPDVVYRLHICLPNREVPTLKPRDDALKSGVECLGGRQDIPGVKNFLWIRIIIIFNHNILKKSHCHFHQRSHCCTPSWGYYGWRW